MFRSGAIVSFMFIVPLAVVKSEKCPNVNPVPNFNLTALTGTWFKVARYKEDTIEKTANGTNITLSFVKNDLTYSMSSFVGNKLHTINGTIKPAPEAEGKGIIIYTMETEDGTHLPNVYIYVLAIDYHKYLILYDCIYNEKTKKATELVWISVRNLHVHKDIEDAINAFVNANHLINLDKLVWERPSDHKYA
ncbi:insecticyanin-A-like isoform X1 [Aricia agestis]|uniref:insecticyanin-A-like isoform X1 n=1 Tax=Aricia agestis TaxID=91739 RepID=UPI001C201FAA|nr:insecticyanin-A-like isoform X1 [Aricia agestis]